MHGGQFTGGVHPQNQLVPKIVSPLPCLSYNTDFFCFIKELIAFIDCLDKCHTSVFNALISSGFESVEINNENQAIKAVKTAPFWTYLHMYINRFSLYW